MFIDVLGWVGSFLLCLCGLPQLYTTFKTKTVRGLSLGMLLAWHCGGICMLIYICCRAPQMQIISNYGLNSLVTSLLLIMYFKYRKNK